MPLMAGQRRDRTLALALAGTAAVVLVRLWFGLHMTFCGTPDSCSYLALAESLGNHHGFTENFLYDFQMDDLHVPTHGIEYWLPGTSFFLLLAKPFGGVTLHSSIVIATGMGVVLSLAAWKIAIDATGNRRIACASYLLCLVLPPMWIGSITPDSALFYAAAVAWFLALFRVRFRSYGEDALAWVCLAVANTIRNDAVLLIVPVLVVLWLRRRSGAPGATTGATKGASPAYAALVVAGFFAAMAPMHMIDYAVLGHAFPSGTSKVLFLTDLGDMSRYSEPATLGRMLSMGMAKLIKIRVAALPLILYRIVFLMLGFGAIFLAALGWRRDRGRRDGGEAVAMPEIAGGAAFGATVVLVYSLILPAIGSFSALRSFGALLPLLAVLIVTGMRRSAGSGEMAASVAAATMLFYLVAGTMEDRRTVAEMNEIGSKDRRVAAFLTAHQAEPGGASLVMTRDSAQFSQTTSYWTMPFPENGLAAVRKAAEALRATHVLIDTDEVKSTPDEVRAALDPVEMAPVPETHIVVVTLRPRLASP